MLLRLLLIVIVAVAAFIWVDPLWNRETRTLALRIRSGDEISALVRSRGVLFANRLAQELREELPSAELPELDFRPPVGAGPPGQSGRSERISVGEQGALDSLIDQKTRE